ncbi:PKD domain-containing protein [Aquimarina sp. U1-2]|uniref:PKD domain-containing protein n=1 Tax=Aquimarina sp. U1-2 TaxID=2823141 RepID=UPI001AEC8B7B|nr:PKD domain-containing protein [Aquimarina sp. U1-2]MBP2831192.1 PKD domain-containing protein [Aquimarina sp. U1-2]
MKHLLFIFGLFCLTITAQEGQEGQQVAPPPQIYPTSPEAASLGKYGEIPINLSTGRINHTIPLHTIKESEFSLPISLSYSYSGLMVEEIPGSAGLGWDLTGRGMITRQVRGLPDESSLGYIGYNKIGEKVYQYITDKEALTDRDKGNILKGSAEGRWDTESDKYLINIGDISATFYFNHKGEAIFAPYKNYKLTYIQNENRFELIDDRGIIYYFTSREETETELIADNPYIKLYTSAWVIDRIVLPNTKEITFTYIPYQVRQFIHSDSQSILEPSLGDIYECQQRDIFEPAAYRRIFSNTSALMLHKISTPSETVTFNYTIRDALITSAGHNPVTLENVKIVNSVGQSVMQYGFSYNDKSKTRKLLKGIHRGKYNPEQDRNYYKFDYYNIPPENIAYYKQDFWGYYNGNTNTTGNLVSQGTNRSPDYQSTLMGALKTIYYPTKGYTEIRYSQNQVYGAQDTGEIGIEDRLNEPIDIVFTSDTRPEDENIFKTISTVFTPQVVSGRGAHISLMYNLQASDGGAAATVTLKRTDGKPIVNCTRPGLGCNYLRDGAVAEQGPAEPATLDRTLFYLEPGEYELKVFVERNAHSNTGIDVDPNNPDSGRPPRVSAVVSLRYSSVNESTSPHSNVSFGGLRVSQTKSCDGLGNCIKKMYSYKTDNISTGISLAKPRYIGGVVHDYGYNVCAILTKTSSSNVPLSTFIGSPVLYKSVTESSIGYNNEMLKTLYVFSGKKDSVEAFPFAPTEKLNWRKGKLIEQKAYKNQEGYFFPVTTTTNKYNVKDHSNLFGKDLKSYNLKVGQLTYSYSANGGLVEYTYVPEHFGIREYINSSETYPLQASLYKEILGNDSISTNTLYTYDDPKGYLKTQTTIDSKSGTQETNYYYPYDKRSTVNDKLVAQNRIANPIETKYKINGAQQSNQVTEYKDWGNTIVMPGITKTAKGNTTPEPRLTYHDYDSYGNPLEVSQADGKSIMYVWGYNYTQPIVKIENASYTGIPSDARTILNQLQTASNTENNTAEEEHMRNLIGNIRRHAYFKKAQVTGYTYDPLIGVTSITDPKGETTYYKYDDFNRLAYVLDQDEHVTQQLRYNYEGQGAEALSRIAISPSVSGTIHPNQVITFTAGTPVTNSTVMYTWSVNSIQEQCGDSSVFQKTFSREGEYTISLNAFDPQTQVQVKKTLRVTVAYPALSTPNISATHTHVFFGTNVVYTASNISGGSGSYRYGWYVNNVKQTNNDRSYTFNTTTAGRYTIFFNLVDTVTGRVHRSSSRVVHIHLPLQVPSISANRSPHIIKGTAVTFTARGIGGGSGNRRYEWYVNGVKQNGQTSISYSNSFSSTGTYSVKFRVVDNNITPAPYYKESNTFTIYSHNSLSTPNVSSSLGSHFLKGATVTFTASNIGGGSGNRRYEWYVNNTRQAYTGTQLRYTFSTKSTYTIKCRVIDNNIPNHIRERSITVQAHDPFSNVRVNGKTYIVKGTEVTFNASASGGSGSDQRRYEWYVNNVRQSGSGRTFKYRYTITGSYQVKCKIIDTRISPTHAAWSGVKTIYSYNPMSIGRSQTSSQINNSNPNVTFRLTSVTQGSGSYSSVTWRVVCLQDYSDNYTSTNTSRSFSFGSTKNGEYNITATIKDNKTGEVRRVPFTVIVNRSGSGSGGGEQW